MLVVLYKKQPILVKEKLKTKRSEDSSLLFLPKNQVIINFIFSSQLINFVLLLTRQLEKTEVIPNEKL